MRPLSLLLPQRICADVGGRIKRLRLAHNLTQQQLSLMAQSSLSSVRRLESQGQGSFELLVRIAQALQAVDCLQLLFAPPMQSIADMEQVELLTTRQRARLPRS